MTIHYRENINQSAMPTFEATILNMTMNQDGHINFPTKYDSHSRVDLRKVAVQNLQRMLVDPEYPTDELMRGALLGINSSVFDMVAHAEKARVARESRIAARNAA